MHTMIRNVTAASVRQASLSERMPFIARLRRASVNPSYSASIRCGYSVAARFLSARGGSSAIEDQMARYQVLEGIAGKAPFTWSRNPPRSMSEVEAHFADTNIDPSWTGRANTGMVGLVWGSLDAFFRKQRGEMQSTADDIIQNGLMGIGKDGSKYSKGPLFYQVGKYNPGIKSSVPKGKDSPRSVGAAAKNFFVQKALNEITELQKQRTTLQTEEGGTQDLTWDQHSGRGRLRIFIDLITDKRDPLGQKLRDMIRETWAGTRAAPPLDRWMDIIEQGGKPKQSQIAKEFGIAGGTLQRNLKGYMQKAITTITGNQRLQDEISEYITREQMKLSRLIARVEKVSEHIVWKNAPTA